MNCPKCQYTWKPLTEAPKMCPRCKARFDYGKWAEPSRQVNA